MSSSPGWQNGVRSAGCSPQAVVPPIIVPMLSPPTSFELSRNYDAAYGSPPPSPLIPPASPALSCISNLTLNHSVTPRPSNSSLKSSSPTMVSPLLARRRGALSLSPLLTPAVLPPAPPSAHLTSPLGASPLAHMPTSAGFSPPLSPRFVNPFDERSQRARQVEAIMQGVRLAPAARMVDVNVAGAGQGRARARSVGAEFGIAGSLLPRSVLGGDPEWSPGRQGEASRAGGEQLSPPDSSGSVRRTTT